MTHIILVAHGRLALEMKRSGEMIYGPLPVSAVEFLKEDGLDSLSAKIKEVSNRYPNQELLILTDLFCGTPYNASCKVAMEEKRQIEVLSGMSLPMLLEGIGICQEGTALELVAVMKQASREACRSFSEQRIEEEEDF